jgi:hypothetical protein
VIRFGAGVPCSDLPAELPWLPVVVVAENRVLVGPTPKGFPMRCLLSLAKTVGCVSVRSLAGGCAIAAAIGLVAPAARGEMIGWIDPPAARSVGEAEACGVRSLDVATDTVTRESIAVLAIGTAVDSKPVAVAPTTPALQAPLADGAKPDVWGTHTERMEWLSVEPTETVSIDPYPTWSAASVVVDDIVTISASSGRFGSLTTLASTPDYRTGVAALGSRFWR